MIIVKCSPKFKSEREYITRVLLSEFLGLEYKLLYQDCSEWHICYDEISSLKMPDILFQTSKDQWLSPESLPKQPLWRLDIRKTGLRCKIIKEQIPVIYGNKNFHATNMTDRVTSRGKTLTLPIDIFGSAFFMLSRYEEAVKADRDAHDRFPALASLAYQEGFLDRPIVNEYLEILWAAMKQIWPRLERKRHSFKMRVSCDVDYPYQEGIHNIFRQIKTIGGDLIHRQNPRAALKNTLNYIAFKLGKYSLDPYLSAIYWIMDINEKENNRVTFFFKAGHTHKTFDFSYSLDEPVIRKLIRDIHARGHEIGLHPSYNTYRDEKLLLKEVRNFQLLLEKENIKQNTLCSRQHYLRWNTMRTPATLENVGIDYDSTLSYADRAGFRCGVCYEFPFYDLIQRRDLILIEKPLIFMEGTLLNEGYMNMDFESVLEYSMLLKNRCKIFNGSFWMVWHNSKLRNNDMSCCYVNIIKSM